MLDFQGLGWNVKLRQRRYSYIITVAKELVLGNGLKQGDQLYSYLIHNDGRNALLIYLDGKERDTPKATLRV